MEKNDFKKTTSELINCVKDIKASWFREWLKTGQDLLFFKDENNKWDCTFGFGNNIYQIKNNGNIVTKKDIIDILKQDYEDYISYN